MWREDEKGHRKTAEESDWIKVASGRIYKKVEDVLYREAGLDALLSLSLRR